jgi:hypothetical protein
VYCMFVFVGSFLLYDGEIWGNVSGALFDICWCAFLYYLVPALLCYD